MYFVPLDFFPITIPKFLNAFQSLFSHASLIDLISESVPKIMIDPR